MFNQVRFARVAIALVGALVLSTLSIGATIGPANAAGANPSLIASLPVGAPAHG